MCKLIDDYVNDLIEDEKAETARLEAETAKLEAELTAAKANEKRSRLESVKRMILMKKISFEDIAIVFGIPVEEVRKIADEVYA